MKSMVIFSLLAIILASCDGGDPIKPPVIPEEKFTITGIVNGSGGTINPFYQTVEKGGNATFTIIPSPGYEIDYLLDDGYKLPAIDIYTVKDVISNDTFEVFFKKDPIVWPLVNIVWKRDSVFFQGKDGVVWFYIEKSLTHSFSIDGKITEVSDGTYINNYYLNKSSFTIKVNTIIYKIESLNEKRMVLSWTTGEVKNWAIYFNLRYK